MDLLHVSTCGMRARMPVMSKESKKMKEAEWGTHGFMCTCYCMPVLGIKWGLGSNGTINNNIELCCLEEEKGAILLTSAIALTPHSKSDPFQ